MNTDLLAVSGVATLPDERRRSVSLAGAIGVLFVLLGIAIRAREYAFNRSLWLDEAMLALKVAGHGLDVGGVRAQVAPLGFLAGVRVATQAFGFSESTLRLIPFIASVAGMLAFYRLTTAHYGARTAAFSTFLLSISGLFIYYATEFKQYGLDGLVGIALLWQFHRLMDARSSVNVATAGIGGAIAAMMSHPALLGLASMGIVLFGLAASQQQWDRVRRLTACGAMWLLAFGVLYRLQIGSAVGSAVMQQFHQPSFAPVAVSEAAVHWYVNQVQTFFMFAVDPRLWLLCAVLFTVGAYALWHMTRPILWLVVVNVILLWAVSALHLYPVHQRFLIYVYPLFLLVIAVGSERLTRGANGWAVLLIMLVMVHPTVADRIREVARPVGREETRELVLRIAQQWRPGDGVVVWGATIPAYVYYRDVRNGTLDARLDFSTLDGDLDRRLTDANVRRIVSSTQHSRLWVIASHMLAGGYGAENLATLRQSLNASTTVEHEWVEHDGFLWYCTPRADSRVAAH